MDSRLGQSRRIDFNSLNKDTTEIFTEFDSMTFDSNEDFSFDLDGLNLESNTYNICGNSTEERLRGMANMLNVSENIPESNRATLREVDEVINNVGRLNECNSAEAFDIGRKQGFVEGEIQGYIMAMINQCIDLESISKKLVLTFNITPQKAESYIRQYYEKKQIVYDW